MWQPGWTEWTTSERATLLRLREQNAPLSEIAAAIGRSVKAVDNFLARNKLPRNAKQPALVKPPSPPREIADSANLRDAIIRSIAIYANDNEIDIDTAAYRLISQGVA